MFLFFNEIKQVDSNLILRKNDEKISLTGGFEPPTFRLTAERSTD